MAVAVLLRLEMGKIAMRNWKMIGMTLWMWSCTTAPELVTVETNELGITALAVEHSADGGNRQLVLHALDGNSRELGTVTLVTGRVLYKSDLDEDGEWVAHGTSLAVTFGASSWSDVAPKVASYAAADPDNAALRTFVHLAPVAGELEREAGITFRAKLPPSPELGYALADCVGTSGLFPQKNSSGATLPNPISCCINFSGSTIWSTYHRQSFYQLSYRYIGPACTTQAGGACDARGGSMGDCYYGPCGAHVNTTWSSQSGTAVFWPDNGIDWCGYDTERNPGLGSYYPQPWTTQDELVGTTNGCNCTQCFNGVAKSATGGDCYHY